VSGIRRRLTHKVNIHPSSQALVGKKKATQWTVDATERAARIDPLTDVEATTLLGRTATETYRVYLAGDENVNEGDKIIWLDRTPNLVFIVRTVQDFSGFNPGQPDHLELTAKLQRAG